MVGVQSALRLTMIVSSDPNIRTFLPSRFPRSDFRVRMFGLLGLGVLGQETGKCVIKLGPPIPTAREAGALGGKRAAAAELSPFSVRVGGELGHELGGRNLLARSENRLQGGEQSEALRWLVALVRQVHRRGARPLGPRAAGDVWRCPSSSQR